MHFVGFSSERFRATQHQARTAKSRTTLATCSYWLMKMVHFDTLGLRDDSNACDAIRRYSHFAIPKYGWKIVMVVPVNWHLNWLELWQLPNHWSLLRMPCCIENSASGDDALRQHALRRRPPGIALAARQAKANWHANPGNERHPRGFPKPNYKSCQVSQLVQCASPFCSFQASKVEKHVSEVC